MADIIVEKYGSASALKQRHIELRVSIHAQVPHEGEFNNKASISVNGGDQGQNTENTYEYVGISSGGSSAVKGALKIIKKDAKTNSPLEGAVFKLQKKNENGEYVDYPSSDKPLKIKSGKDGFVLFEGLATGEYKIIEVSSPEGYSEELIIEDEEFSFTAGDEGIVREAWNIPTTSIEVEKVWQGSEEDSVTINLLADGEETDKTIELSDDNDWSYVFTDLDAFDSKGEAIEYTVEEEKVAGYESEITGSAEGGFTVTNTRTGKTEVPVKKVWQGSKKDSVTIKLLADGEETDKTIELSDDNDWSYVFTDLDAFDSKGEAIKYTVEEIEIEGYSVEITGDAKEGFTITNTRSGETEVSVEKVWELYEKEAEAIIVNLLQNGEVFDTIELS